MLNSCSLIGVKKHQQHFSYEQEEHCRELQNIKLLHRLSSSQISGSNQSWCIACSWEQIILDFTGSE